ncbi:MAG TPA: nucleoside triphosphate pyrophosphohydrolase [Candidatus Goldiibacteriota bacterium]|nr:nucleoside triphosphate pyrophosphohydrolase [Candidatus Goldiibacteriota bacterium]
MSDSEKEFTRLIKIMEKLRGQGGCPWDRKQTHKTLLPYLLEETYELIEAIDKNDKNMMMEEIGDLLLQIVFHSQIMKEETKNGIEKVIKNLNDKLIRRHPHVFSDKKGLYKDYHVLELWEKNKKKEKKRKSILDGVPIALPSLLRARRLISKASTLGFRWNNNRSIINKIKEELNEVIEELNKNRKKELEEEIGDLLFVITALAYYNKINAENALYRANNKFMKRFMKIENEINADMNEKDILKLWEKAKKD